MIHSIFSPSSQKKILTILTHGIMFPTWGFSMLKTIEHTVLTNPPTNKNRTILMVT